MEVERIVKEALQDEKYYCEADFQGTLIRNIIKEYKNYYVLNEFTIPDFDGKALDIFAINKNNNSSIGIEIKFKIVTEYQPSELGKINEVFTSNSKMKKGAGGQDRAYHGFWTDIKKLQYVKKELVKSSFTGYAIFITNDALLFENGNTYSIFRPSHNQGRLSLNLPKSFDIQLNPDGVPQEWKPANGYHWIVAKV